MAWPRRLAWASYQTRKIAFAHAPGMPGTFSPPPTSKETASQRSRHASRHVRHTCALMRCMSKSLSRGVGENVPGIPGACSTRNFTYLARGSSSRAILTSWQANIFHITGSFVRETASHRRILSRMVWPWPDVRARMCQNRAWDGLNTSITDGI